ncbi:MULTISPECIES: GMC family oxidoreductase [Curtobacterium]|uniref:GMC family oxidoreductase n=2 Tax=Curtobacterium TaxID=2034 RepID=A0A9Q2ZNW7_9MICO|nr:GMC family oxidoreductase [Curtobacterium flaccumfaciens]KIQ12767.1 ribonuclease BN [Curtobacterium flaccumfaciens]MBT1540682.1 GMC family oxidoreductase [Curtobacterium flaccumfaciens pv. flaccumfaciens]MBT1611409.1 GMC family oxidoreductase [Curtobacterium flaccumfaciens pv. poinsettiae]MCX2847621.1 GMC family oxidoreductase [Curtobacterium flaccumfaciens pv. poinsettiae]UXN17290.1 GMC family oxidoreductase [Curtobacterium flaccumfaciens pv. poinsettiae]
MRLDGQRTYGTDDVVDVVVVGTGAGGAPLLASLARRGLTVVALEAGRNTEPGDHVPDEVAAPGDINWMDERLSGGGAPTAFGPNNSGTGVGGSTLHWGAFTPRPSAHDLRLRTESGEGQDWPISHAELTGWIEQVEHDVGVAGPEHYPWDPSRRYRMRPPARNASSDMMMRGTAAAGITATDAPVGLTTEDRHQEHHGLRQACVSCGSCHQGCRNGAKVSMDTTYLPAAVAFGAEIRPESFVHGIELDSSGRVEAVVYTAGGREHRQRCRSLVLAAGGVETPRLLLHTGVANGSGQVGRNFTAHGATQVWARFDESMRSYRGYPSSIITEDFVRPADADFAGGYLIQSLGAQPQTFATSLVRGGGLRGAELVRALHDYPFSAGVGINAECLPYDDNRLQLTDELDEHGVPRARVSFTPGSNEEAIRRHAVRTMTTIVEAAGGQDVRVLERTAHTIGTARMGTDRETSVVDQDGRSWDVPNLWIADNSVFPSAVIANPALTIMALSLRTADRMLQAA